MDLQVPICLLAFLLASLLVRSVTKRRRNLPPGPKPLPIIGNLKDIFQKDTHQWQHFASWKRKYGDLTYVEVFGKSMLILNSSKATTDLLERRSAIYSDRPDMIMVNDLMGWYWDFAHQKYSDWWRLHRKTFHTGFQPSVVSTYHDIQLRGMEHFLRNMLKDPEDFSGHIRHYTGSVSLASDALKKLVEAVGSGNYLVDVIPALKYVPAWFPGAKFKRLADEWSKDVFALRDVPFNRFKSDMEKNRAQPCFAKDILTKTEQAGQLDTKMEEVIKNCASVAYLAGADTTVGLIFSFFLAMVLHPDAQKRAQEELDRVIGRDRLPDFKDRPHLPYIEACLSEVLRWMPVTPLAVPHQTTQPDIYEGYHIPAGTVVIGNVWAILHNPEVYPDPEVFKPERFLLTEGDAPPHPINYAFGFGRRICPGRHFATNTAWLAIAATLSVYNISPLDKENLPKYECTEGAAS
ncbi:cytochrome P450 [Dendrothele bispora CBS 962.96]|uniref:Cytochrome P450 n=1 Tax=Dendrothele bispora (strain CBS 962.96) TaxID=1314807 RepID=A0A4S8M9Y6_DENBC|nr:cytochrome P450 [Dendrothele bispora CBS 962.96]